MYCLQENKEIFIVVVAWSDDKRVFLSLFSEGESFEAFCPARLDELLREALRLEKHLKNQKERLRERLTLITRTLQKPAL